LFQAFSQADASTTRKYGGTGLGLTISKHFVELMHGRIWAESEAGVGSKFKFVAWFGLDEKAERAPLVSIKGYRALVVDDSAVSRSILSEQLHHLDLRVDAVASGQECLDLLKQTDAGDPYKIVFMDWRMPEMDGIEATRRLYADCALTAPPLVVMVTAFGAGDVVDQAQEAGAKCVLNKPVSQSSLWDTLATLFADPAARTGSAIGHAGASSQAPDLTGYNVLLTEDNEINQQIAVEIMESAGVRVTVANHGKEALDLLTNAPDPLPWSLVFMDMQMPVMDGHQATAAILKIPRLAGIPIVAMTAHAMAEERAQCLAEGMKDHITKPIDPDILLQTVQKWGHKQEGVAAPAPAAPTPASQPAPAAATTAAPPPAPAAIGEIPGVDMEKGIARVGGKRDFYIRILQKFADSKAETPKEVRDALQAGDSTLASRVAHTLVGIAANVNASGVEAAARKVEHAINKAEPAATIAALIDEMEAILTPVIAGIRKAFSPAENAGGGAETVAVDMAQVSKICKSLATLLAADDPAAGPLLDANAALLKAALGDAFANMAGKIRSFDYDEALEVLNDVVAAKGIKL
jgi:two-component system sensor histidine kinase/response regulator